MARVLVESLLVEEFGVDMGLDAGFQAVIDEVVDAIHAHAATGVELDRLVASLAGSRPDL